MENLLQWDYHLFELINGTSHSFFDAIAIYWRDKMFWIPLYLLIFWYLLKHFAAKKVGIILLGAILVVVLSDQISSGVIKPLVKRDRPCKNPDLAQDIHLIVACGSGKSFVSSHATNHFAIAIYLGMLLKVLLAAPLALLLFWAASISYCQVYVGVHYPRDVFAGAILGLLIGSFVFWLLQHILLPKLHLE